MTINETEGIKLSKLANTVTGIVHSDVTFPDLMKTVLNFAIAFEEHDKKFVVARIEDIGKDVMGSDFLTGKTAQSY